jgi:hypothetical protein
VRWSNAGPRPEPRPAGCAVEILEKRPERPHDEIAELTEHVTRPPADGVLGVLRAPACAVGADAVIVVRRVVVNDYGHLLVSGVAIKYRTQPAPSEPPAPPAAEPATPRPAEPPALPPAQPAGAVSATPEQAK